ncbi:MAG: hypothetical protein C0407_02040 [Desulfobacca sp.]|nr:hypothetical protein [Desulfobacca sp.]
MGVSILVPHLQLKQICHNLSKEGCFFMTSDLGSVGKTFSLIIDPPEIGLIVVEGRISHKGEDGKGSGVEFVSIEPEDQIKLAYFLEIFE